MSRLLFYRDDMNTGNARSSKKREMIYLDRGDIVGGRGNWVTSRFQGYKKRNRRKNALVYLRVRFRSQFSGKWCGLFA